jgi:hypothetical protein
MHYLKIVSKGWQGYTGQLNIISFKDGVSTEPVPPRIADRIAASVQVVQCDEKGKAAKKPVAVGVQHRLISETAARAIITTSLQTQSEADKSLEAKLDAARSLTAPVETLFTRVDLEKIADDTGMKGLRDIGDKWKVKGRGIPELIEKILKAQAQFLQLRNQKMDQAGGSVLKATTLATEEEEATIAVDETPAVAGVEGMTAEYTVLANVVTAADLFESALRNSGKSLTGWNALRDNERKILVDQEIAALEGHYGAKLEPVVVGEAPAEDVKEPEVPAEPEEQEAPADEGEGAEGEKTDGAEGEADESKDQGEEA